MPDELQLRVQDTALIWGSSGAELTVTLNHDGMLLNVTAQIRVLGVQADWVLDQSFPQMARGMHLDYHAQMQGISRTPGTCAAGPLRFETPSQPASESSIPAGTVCMTREEVRFQTTADAVLTTDVLFVDVPAQALETGSSGNVVAGAVCVMTACPVGITACTNPQAFSGGGDPEGDESLRQCILESYQQVAMGHAGVAAVMVVGRGRGIGTVGVYIATETGIPDGELLAEETQDLAEKSEIAVDVQVLAPETKTVDITLELDAGGGDFDDLCIQVEAALRALFSGRLLGHAVLLVELGSLVYGVEGVQNYRLPTPAEDLAALGAVLPVLGEPTITQMEA